MAAVKSIDSIFEFATSLQQSLLHQDQPKKDISAYLDVLPLSRKHLSSSDQAKLEKQGVALWNICGKLRQAGQLLAQKDLLSQARAFAYLLLESASEADSRSLKNALRVARECLDAKLLELALKIVGRVALLLETLGDCSNYVAEYLLLRLALALQQDRLDLAEHFFAKLQTVPARPTAEDALNCVDLLFDIGRYCLEKKHYELAARWLERAVVMLQEHDLVSGDASDLRLNIMQTYARASLELADADTGLLRAKETLETLQQLYGRGNAAVLLLQLEIASRGDLCGYVDGLDALSRLHLTDWQYKAVMYHIHHIRKLDPARARRCLQQYLVERLAVNGNDQWIEGALIALVWICASSSAGTASLDAAFTELGQIWTKPLSTEATRGILVLLWKPIEEEVNKEEYEDATAWCQLAMHQLLSTNRGGFNAGRIQRKLLHCLLKQSKLEAARDAALAMSPDVKRHPLSLYLTYCIAIRVNDEDLAPRVFMQASSNGVLLSCVCETLRYELDQAHSVEQTSAKICKVFEIASSHIFVADSFSLLDMDWFTRTLLDLVQRFYKEWSTQSMVQLLSHVAKLPFHASPNASFADQDRQLIEELRKRQAISLFALAILHTTEARTAKSAEARIKAYKKVKDYAYLFKQQIYSFLDHSRCPASIGLESSTFEESHSSIHAQRITLLSIEFEACLHISNTKTTPVANDCQANTLSSIINEALVQNAPAKAFVLFADLILCAVSGGPHNGESLISVDTAAKLLRQLIGAAQGREGYGVIQASRWIRCIVQLVLTGSEQGIESESMKLVEEVVEQAVGLAASGNSQEPEGEDHGNDTCVPRTELRAAYPAEELEWLATTLFNLAVDYYVGEEEELGKKWAGKAAELADVLATSRDMDGDGGLLASVLRGRMNELGWSA